MTYIIIVETTIILFLLILLVLVYFKRVENKRELESNATSVDKNEIENKTSHRIVNRRKFYRVNLDGNDECFIKIIDIRSAQFDHIIHKTILTNMIDLSIGGMKE